MKQHSTILFSLLLLCSISAKAQIVSGGMVAYYPFTGNTRDTTSNAYDLTNTGVTFTKDRFGRANHAGFFNGSSLR